MSPTRRRQPKPSKSAARTDMVLQDEKLDVTTATEETGRVRARKRIETERVEQSVQRGVERADVERAAGDDPADSGEILTLDDGSVSIPIFEEQIVVTKRLVVRERIIIRKRTIYEEHTVSADLRREHLDVTTAGDVTLAADQ